MSRCVPQCPTEIPYKGVKIAVLIPLRVFNLKSWVFRGAFLVPFNLSVVLELLPLRV